MEHPLAKISNQSVQEKIYELEQCNRNLLSINELKLRIQSLLDGYSCLTRTVSSPHAWRARKNESIKDFKNVSEVWYPKPKFVQAYGRLNRPKKPMLYVAASHQTAILEMRPTVGDRFTVLQLRLRDNSRQPHLMELGVAEMASMKGNKSPNILENTKIGREFLSEHAEKNLLIRSFLAREFTRTVNRGEEHLFKITAAIAEILLSSPKIHGVLYPSMAGSPSAITTAENMALKPSAADRLYIPETCWIAEVEGIEEGPTGGFKMRCIKNASAIEPDGKIIWNK